MSLTLRQIRYFLAAAETGQVSQAAHELHVSQSAVTTAIKGLEAFLDTQLFDRHAQGVALTYEGHHFLQRARNVMAAVEEAARVPNKAHDDIGGILRISISYTVSGYFLPNYLARFARSFPRVELKLNEADRPEIEEGLISDRFDVAVMLTSNLLNQEDITYETLLRSRRRLWLGSEHPFLERSSVSLQDIASEPYIMLTVDEASNTAQRYWNRTPYRPNTVFRTSSVEAVRSMVANGSGLSILSDMVYRPWSLEGKRVEVKAITDPVPTMDVGLAWSREIELSPAAAAFCEFMHLSVASHHS